MPKTSFLASCLMLGLAVVVPAQAANGGVPTVLGSAAAPLADAAARQRAAGILVRFRDPAVQALAAANEAPPARLLTVLEAASGAALNYVRAMSGGMHVLRFEAPLSAVEAERIIDRLRTLTEVERAEPDYILKPQAFSSDPRFSDQWSLFPPATEFASSIDAMAAWGITTGSPDVVVAVIDTGVVRHPEFDARLVPGYDFISDVTRANDGNGRDADATDPGDFVAEDECWEGSPAETSSWHGTHVAGIIGADGNNGIGIAGVAWQTRIQPVRVLGKCGGTVGDVVDGVRWAAGLPVPGVPDNTTPARVLNLSLGGYTFGCFPAYAEAINDVANAGAFAVMAAGNERLPFEYATPGNCARALAVMAVDQYAELASYSNYSADGSGIAAPGGDMRRYGESGGILSTVTDGVRGPGAASYAYYQGTSMATPHVAGIAALLLARRPDLGVEEMHALILKGARDFSPGSNCAVTRRCGMGLADAPGALDAADRFEPYALVQEFYNGDLAHYFRTASSEEAAGVANGAAGRNWRNTASFFYVWPDASEGAQPVCRFYGTPGVGPNSHFYTVSPAECEAVKRDPGWLYEGVAFYAKEPVAEACPVGTVPVYRAYNNRWRENDSNHRYTTDLHQYRAMTTITGGGWVGEGIAMCVAG